MLLFFVWLGVSCIVIQVYTVIRWSGGWRIAALVAFLLTLVFPLFAFSVRSDGLLGYTQLLGWFAWVIFGSVGASVGCCYLLILVALRGLVTSEERKDGCGSPSETAVHALPPTSSQEDTRIQRE